MEIQKANNDRVEYQKIDALSNDLWDNSKIFDRIVLFGIISLSLLMILKILIFPMVVDDWFYGSTYPISNLFSLEPGNPRETY